MRALFAICWFPLALCISEAHANLRAPREEPHPPSSALRRTDPSAEVQIQVHGEVLSIDCAVLCHVTATYDVEVGVPAFVTLEFVLPPQAGPVSVELPGAPRPLLVPTEPVPEAELAGYRAAPPDRDRGPQLARARFAGPLRAGRGQIRIVYQQPPERHERDYGYFKKGRFVEGLRYELWPLREWTLARDFALHLRVSMAQRRPGFFKRHFGRVRAISCEGQSGVDLPNVALPSNGRVTQGDTALLYEVTLPASFPDRLHCNMGDSDLILPRRGRLGDGRLSGPRRRSLEVRLAPGPYFVPYPHTHRAPTQPLNSRRPR